MRISDWSSDVCSSDLLADIGPGQAEVGEQQDRPWFFHRTPAPYRFTGGRAALSCHRHRADHNDSYEGVSHAACRRSEEHTSELQSLMRISYAVFCLKKKK